MRALLDLFSSRQGRPPARPARTHMVASAQPAVIYAIGDIHGCLSQLRAMEAAIVADAAAFEGTKWIVTLGDYVDRGPNSAGVIDHLLMPAPAGFTRICLAGNHEVLMLDYLDNPSDTHDWLRFGGHETLMSYGIDPFELHDRKMSASRRRAMLDSHIPPEHLDFLGALPISCSVDNIVLVHAGMRSGMPVGEQVEDDLLWMRYKPADPGPQGLLVVHGHTPQETPLVLPNRICVDTGVFTSGILSAVRLTPSGPPRLLQTGGNPLPPN